MPPQLSFKVLSVLTLCLLPALPALGAGRAVVVPAPAAAGAPIDLNSADVATLAGGLRGIGESKARAIVEHRRLHGPFRSVDELALVKGIGPKTVERNRARLRVGGVTAVVPGGAASRTPVRSGVQVREQRPIIIEGMPRDGS